MEPPLLEDDLDAVGIIEPSEIVTPIDLPRAAVGCLFGEFAVLEQTLRAADMPFVTGRTWTTDAVYRETRARAARRVAEVCLTVGMEAAAFFAVAR